MTPAEYLAGLQNFVSSFSHSEPIPEINKDIRDKFEDLLPPEALKPLLDISKDISTHKFNSAYHSPQLEVGNYDRDRCDVYLQLLNDYAELIKKFYAGIGLDIYNFPHLGVLPIGTLDAVTLRVPDCTQRLVVFNSGLFSFLFILAKIAVVCSTRKPSEPDGQGNVRMCIPGICTDKFKELFTTYLLHGSPDRTEQWLLEERMLPALENLTTSSELFLLGHEVVHALFGHLNDDDVTSLKFMDGSVEIKSLNKTLENEREADFYGAKMALVARSGNLVPVTFAGIEIAIAGRQMIDNAHRIFARADVDPASVYENPRIRALHQSLLDAFGENVRPHIDFGRMVCTIFDFLWRQITPHLIEMRDSGKAIATVWQPPV